MSWVSILEDAVKRFESDLHMLQEAAPPDEADISAERLREVRLVVARGEAILFDAWKHLDMATDPSLDIVAAMRQSEEGKHALEVRLWEYDKTCRSLMSSLNRERARADKLQQELAAVKGERHRLEKQLEATMRSNPGAVYDAYSRDIGKRKGSE